MSLIAIDARESGTSTGRYIDKLIEYIYKINPNYDINIITKPEQQEYMKKIAPKYTVVPTTIKELSLETQTKFLSLVNSLDADLVHYGMVTQPVRYKGRVVTTIHDTTMTKSRFRNPLTPLPIFEVKKIVYNKIFRLAAKKSSIIITPTKYVKEDVMKFTGQPASKFVVTYESADKIKDKADPFKKLLNKRFLLYVGRPWPHKNLNRLVDAFNALQAKYPDLCLVLAGEKNANYEKTEKNAEDRGIKNVILTDFISEGQLRWLYENCAAYIFPSLSEGFGLPGLEAMIHGAPVVSSSATCLPEVYGEAAVYFDSKDVNNMAETISNVMSNDKLRIEMIEKGYQQVAKYSWEKMAKQTLEVYERALKS